MSDRDDESIARAEGGESSGTELEYELVAEEEHIDVSFETSEVHPKAEYPRVAYGSSGQHPEALPPRVVLTNRPTNVTRSLQTSESLLQIAEDERSQQESVVEDAAASQGQLQPRRPSLRRRISERLQQMKHRSPSKETKPKK